MPTYHLLVVPYPRTPEIEVKDGGVYCRRQSGEYFDLTRIGRNSLCTNHDSVWWHAFTQCLRSLFMLKFLGALPIGKRRITQSIARAATMALCRLDSHLCRTDLEPGLRFELKEPPGLSLLFPWMAAAEHSICVDLRFLPG